VDRLSHRDSAAVLELCAEGEERRGELGGVIWLLRSLMETKSEGKGVERGEVKRENVLE
jgi:hypothetical protein